MIKTKIPISRLIIGSILLILLFLWIRWVIHDFRDFKMIHDIEINFIKGLKVIFFSNSFIKPVLLTIAIVGFFMFNVFGWITICNLFYFIAFEMTFIAIPGSSNNWYDYLALLIPLSMVILMNTKSIKTKYNITSNLTVTINFISILISMSLTYLKGYIHLNHRFNIWEIIDKIT